MFLGNFFSTQIFCFSDASAHKFCSWKTLLFYCHNSCSEFFGIVTTQTWDFELLKFRTSPDIPTDSLGVPFFKQLGVFIIPEISIYGFNWQSEIKKESKPCFVFLFTTLDFAVSSLTLSLTTSMVIFVAPVDNKCLKIDLASGLLLLFSNYWNRM